MKCLIFIIVASKKTISTIESELLQYWVGLCSLPWLVSEMNWHDLKPTNKNLLISIAQKASWINGKLDFKEDCKD